jgi:hypothetical protein
VLPNTRAACRLDESSDLGDADLYLRFSNPPDPDNALFDCASSDVGSKESCSVDVPEGVSQIWAVMQAYSLVEHVVITCASETTVSLIRLVDGVDSAPLSLSANMTQVFQLRAREESNVICEMHLSTPNKARDADLYVSFISFGMMVLWSFG